MSTLRISGLPTPSAVGSGLLALDIVISEVSGIAPGYWAGGTCGNVLIALSYLGWDSQPVARLRGGVAADRILSELNSFGLSDAFVSVSDDGSTPIIVERITVGSGNVPRHSFSWRCPECGSQFPGFKPVLASVAETIAARPSSPEVYFFDRATAGSILLARAFAERGSLIVFEPSSIGNQTLFRQACETSHVVKYARDRLRELPEIGVERFPLLQIETLGAAGLRFRRVVHRGRVGRWVGMGAIPIDSIRDTAGSGDWCTAGFLDRAGRSGPDGFSALSETALQDALRYGQALAAFNCGYEGARGGMYAVDRATFVRLVQEILDGRRDGLGEQHALHPAQRDTPWGLGSACLCMDVCRAATGTSGPA